MVVNYSIDAGTEIAFGPSSRLRRIVVDERTKASKLTEYQMHEGILIGEGKRAKIISRIEQNSKIAYVVETSTGHFGWVYNFEFNVV